MWRRFRKLSNDGLRQSDGKRNGKECRCKNITEVDFIGLVEVGI